MVDADSAPVALRFAIEPRGEIVWRTDPITLIKATKTRPSWQGIASAISRRRRVGQLARLSREVPQRKAAGNPLTELEVRAQQLAFRKQQPGFIEQSFATISASSSNAAMCHYHSSEASNKPIGHDHFT